VGVKRVKREAKVEIKMEDNDGIVHAEETIVKEEIEEPGLSHIKTGNDMADIEDLATFRRSRRRR
jgi:hypothetical protein